MTPSDFEAAARKRDGASTRLPEPLTASPRASLSAPFSPPTLPLSVSLPEKALPRLQQKLLSPDFPLGAVEAATDGSRVTVTPAAFPDTPAQLCDWILFCIRAAVSTVDNAYSDPPHFRHRQSRFMSNPCAARAGALLGALVGIIPWLLTGLIGWQFWLLGGLVGIASFYGYRLFRGAHRTGFALAAVLVTSLLAVIGCELTGAVVQNQQLVCLNSAATRRRTVCIMRNTAITDAPLTKEDLNARRCDHLHAFG